MGYDVDLGVQSYCFRTYDNHADVIKAVQACGLSAIELCGKHLKLADGEEPAPVLKQYTDAGIAVSSYGVNRFSTDEAAARRVFEFAKLAGFGAISTSVGKDGAEPTFRMLEQLGEAYDVNLAIHNHGRKDWLGSPETLQQVFAGTSSRIGLCLDTAWMLDSGADPVAIAAKFADRLYGLHIKDFVFDEQGKPEDVIVGTGNLDLKALLALLQSRDFKGYVTLEYEGDVADPVPSTKRCVEAVKATAAAL
ncbi:MAG: TIM barrel protein [Kiritimatiellae bacterium]|nr:TIM barrel protein [Kiritimatiellia bacterium]